MDAVIGRYRVRMEEEGLTIRHEAGINFDLSVEETWALLHFLDAYRETLERQRDSGHETEPRLKRVTLQDE